MAAISFPPNDTPSTARTLYTSSPWTDPSGNQWLWSAAKERWSPISETVENAVTDNNTNAVSSNAVFDALTLKAPLANPTFTGTVTATGAITGTTGTFSGAVAAVTPSIGVPAFTTGAHPTSGLAFRSSIPQIITSSIQAVEFPSTGVRILNNGIYAFTATSSAGASSDTGLSRKTSTPGTLRIGNGAANDASGSLELTNLTASGTVTAGAAAFTDGGAQSGSGSFVVTTGGTASNAGTIPVGTWAARVFNQLDQPHKNGMLVMNRWAGPDSTVFQVGSMFNLASQSFFRIDGSGETTFWGSVTTTGVNAFIQSRSTFNLFNGTHATTLSHAPTSNNAIAFPNASGTIALTSGPQTFSGAQAFTGAVSVTDATASTTTTTGALKVAGGLGVVGAVNTGARVTASRGTVGVGTVFTNLSLTDITGTSTDFLSRFVVGDSITVNTTAGSQTRVITAIASDTSMTTLPFSGPLASGAEAYTHTAASAVMNPSGAITGRTGKFSGAVSGTTGFFTGTVTAGGMNNWTGSAFSGTQAFTGDVSVTGNTTVAAIAETAVAIGTVTTTATISITAGTLITATLTASTACTFTMPTAAAGKSFTLLLKQAAATGNGTATFTSVKWPAGTAPTITATAGRMDLLTFVSDGTNWYGSAAQNFTP